MRIFGFEITRVKKPEEPVEKLKEEDLILSKRAWLTPRDVLLIEKFIRDNPNKSDNDISGITGFSASTINRVRRSAHVHQRRRSLA